ncbi:MAG: hypothetical protein ABI758_01400 [Candidatus Woesebacteria bacterium]
MKKEVGIAIVFGLIVGLIITVGMYRARTALQTPLEESPSPFTQDGSTPSATVLPENASELRVTAPLDEDVRTVKDILVSGATLPNSTIVILHNEHEVLGTSDTEGNFSIPLVLETGANVLRIRVLSTSRAPMEIIRTVVFESSQPEPTPTASASGTVKKATPKPTLRP